MYALPGFRWRCSFGAVSADELMDDLHATQRAISRLAAGFADAAGRALTSALHRRIEDLIVSRADWFNRLDPESVSSLRRSVDDAISVGAEEIAEQLRDEALWIEPATLREAFVETPDVDVAAGPLEVGHGAKTTGRRVREPMPSGTLDDPMNRVWVRLTNGADRLDGVLTEFGLTPNSLPDPGGGHYGLQPRTAHELDPSGELARLWREYLELYARHRRLEARAEGERASRAEEKARRRWRESS